MSIPTGKTPTYSFETLYAFFIKHESPNDVLSYVEQIQSGHRILVEYVARISFGDPEILEDTSGNIFEMLAFVGTFKGERSILMLAKSGDAFFQLANYDCQSDKIVISGFYNGQNFKRTLHSHELEELFASIYIYFFPEFFGYYL